MDRKRKNAPLIQASVLPSLFSALAAAIFLVFPGAAAPASPERVGGLYYARFDMKTVNGVVTRGNLLIVPAKGEYRATDFKVYRINGFSEPEPGVDPESAARHDAVSKLLIANGLKSVENRNTSLKTGAHDETVVSYEGVVRYPALIHEKGYTGRNRYAVDMEIQFSPISHPDQWGRLSLKHKLSKTMDNIISIFK